MRARYAGTDIRVSPTRLDPWDAARRETFLLRADVTRPLSVDPLVWPRHARAEEVGEAVPWVGVDQICRVVAGWSHESNDSPVVIAIGAVAEDAGEETLFATKWGTEADIQVEDGWRFAGFDVADDPRGISGLCNCGYAASDALLVRRDLWGPRLNEHGLFSEEMSAFDFRKLTDVRVPEHAPFAVFGLWIVSS